MEPNIHLTCCCAGSDEVGAWTSNTQHVFAAAINLPIVSHLTENSHTTDLNVSVSASTGACVDWL